MRGQQMALMLSDGEMHPPGNAELQLGMCQKKSLERLHCEFHPAGPGSSQHIDFNDWGHILLGMPGRMERPSFVGQDGIGFITPKMISLQS